MNLATRGIGGGPGRPASFGMGGIAVAVVIVYDDYNRFDAAPRRWPFRSARTFRLPRVGGGAWRVRGS
jgi:hypothetical protein